ncbi:MAG: hypothetical protein ACO3HF_08395 [Burkholderiaceae bacterium]|jgi:hypothetical protein
MDFSNRLQISLEADQLSNQHGIETVQRVTKPKTINVTPTTHKALRDYCLAAGLKLQAVADKAIAAWLRKAAK